MRSILSRKIGIDLGTSTVRIYVKGEGVVVNEPARGRAMWHLPQLIGKAHARPRLFRPDVVVSVPSAVTSDERCAVTEAAIAAGARQVWLIDEPLAAAMGAGLPIGGPRACAICEIGAATTEIAVFLMSGTVVEHSIPVGGNSFDQAIAGSLGVDPATAESVKIAAGSAVTMGEPLLTVVDGVEFSSNQVADAIAGPLRAIADAVRDVLEQTPPQVAADVHERGLVLSGGGAQLRGLDRYLAERTGLPVAVADEPQTSVVRGTGLALETFEVLKRNLTYAR
ncbi:MAG TPA: rod shape-determining protein [Candidatus Dormibacteraeota bacterium]|nr:rod shape-determining protein [Candidatus Dormibacteraeota bacterium]